MIRNAVERVTVLLMAMGAALVAMSQPARATMDWFCGGEGVSAHFESSAGIVSVFELTADGRTWSTHPEHWHPGAELIYVRDTLEDGEESQTDFSDTRGGSVIATLRVHYVREGDSYAHGGVLSIVGVGAWAVSCDG